MKGEFRLMAAIIYGGGLRLQECLTLRVKDIDFNRNCLNIRRSKGDKDRQTIFSDTLTEQPNKNTCNAHFSHAGWNHRDGPPGHLR